jgi:succinyl-diaminopimelate desuccinylase
MAALTSAAVPVPGVERLLRTLVAKQSQTGTPGEKRVCELIAAELKPYGFETEFVPLTDDGSRVSLGARLAGSGDGPTLVLNGHVDTVPVGDIDLWSVDPFAGEIRDGELIGRGALDMKAGLTAQILCAQAIGCLPPLPGTLVLHFAAGEESGEPGTTSLLNGGFGGDFGIVTEPTELRIGTEMRGMCAYRILIVGRSAHVGEPEAGLNPIGGARDLLVALERYDAEVQTRVVHPRLPPTRATVTMINAGQEQSSVAESAEVVVDRRLVPGETHQTGLAELRQLVDGLAAQHPDLGWQVEPVLWFEPCAVDDEHVLVRCLAESVERVRGEAPPLVATPSASDVTRLVHEGSMPAVQFGPGGSHLHAPDERVRLDDITVVARALMATAFQLLSDAKQVGV